MGALATTLGTTRVTALGDAPRVLSSQVRGGDGAPWRARLSPTTVAHSCSPLLPGGRLPALSAPQHGGGLPCSPHPLLFSDALSFPESPGPPPRLASQTPPSGPPPPLPLLPRGPSSSEQSGWRSPPVWAPHPQLLAPEGPCPPLSRPLALAWHPALHPAPHGRGPLTAAVPAGHGTGGQGFLFTARPASPTPQGSASRPAAPCLRSLRTQGDFTSSWAPCCSRRSQAAFRDGGFLGSLGLGIAFGFCSVSRALVTPSPLNSLPEQ